jgi:hypothetical protein
MEPAGHLGDVPARHQHEADDEPIPGRASHRGVKNAGGFVLGEHAGTAHGAHRFTPTLLPPPRGTVWRREPALALGRRRRISAFVRMPATMSASTIG